MECPVSSSPLPVDGHLGTVNVGVGTPVYHVDFTYSGLKSHLVVRLLHLTEAIFVILGTPRAVCIMTELIYSQTVVSRAPFSVHHGQRLSSFVFLMTATAAGVK